MSQKLAHIIEGPRYEKYFQNLVRSKIDKKLTNEYQNKIIRGQNCVNLNLRNDSIESLTILIVTFKYHDFMIVHQKQIN